MFNDSIKKLDFLTDPVASRNEINGFVEEVTKNNIKELLTPDAITSNTHLVVANAAYFKGQWASKFEQEDTKPTIFYDHGRMPVYVDMMKQRGTFNYGK